MKTSEVVKKLWFIMMLKQLVKTFLGHEVFSKFILNLTKALTFALHDICYQFNSFAPNFPFLYLLKTFSGDVEMEHTEYRAKKYLKKFCCPQIQKQPLQMFYKKWCS